MENDNIKFTAIDRIVFDSYKVALEGLSLYLGNGYEIVLHSLEDFEHSVVAIYNGERSGRHIGAPVTDLALQMLSKIENQGTQDNITYFNKNKAGEPLKSTTILIRGENKRIIGLLCINFYLNTSLFSMINSWSAPENQHNFEHIETFVSEANDLVGSVLEETIQRVNNDPSISHSNYNKEVVNLLYDRGVFNLKNAVNEVAERLHISRNTVYMHIRNSEKNLVE